MFYLPCDFKIWLTVFNQSYNCQTSHYLSRNQLPDAFLMLPSLHPSKAQWDEIILEVCKPNLKADWLAQSVIRTSLMPEGHESCLVTAEVQYTKSLVNTNLVNTNFTNTHFQKVPIPHLTRSMKQKFLH